jgi:hypothetical protein
MEDWIDDHPRMKASGELLLLHEPNKERSVGLIMEPFHPVFPEIFHYSRPPWRVRAFLFEPEVIKRVNVALKNTQESEANILRQAFQAEVIKENFEVARLLSAVPELEGKFDPSYPRIRFEPLGIPNDCDQFPPRPGPLHVVVVISPSADVSPPA